eukprot:SAG11_NODE_2681_length_3103_cov_2.475699_4_plen_132_part_00
MPRFFKLIPAHGLVVGGARARPDVADDRAPCVGVLVPAPTSFVLNYLESQSEPRHTWAQAHKNASKGLGVLANSFAACGSKHGHKLCASISNLVDPRQRGFAVLARNIFAVTVAAVAWRGDKQLPMCDITE